jgi:FkbM family methyltransferase
MTIATRLVNRLKWPLRRILERYGLDIRFAPTLNAFLKSRNVDVVLDVGANEGQFAISLRQMGYDGIIVSFEPIKSVFQKLSQSASNDPNWKVQRLALGDASGTGEVQITESTVFSSLLPQTGFANDFNGTRPVAKETVPVERLDTLFGGLAGKSTFLKIDTQGHEKKVIDGAQACLDLLVGIQLELPVVHLYSETWNLPDALAFMNDKGFVLSQVRPTNFMHGDPSLVEIDCVFRKANFESA